MSSLRRELSSERLVSLLADRTISDSTRRLTAVLDHRSSDLVIIPSSFVVWATLESSGVTVNALGNHERLFAEFYVGAANTVFSDDPIHKYRALIDTPFSKGQIRRQGRVPKYSYKYGMEHYGVVEPVECPIGMYVDQDSLSILARSRYGNPPDLHITRRPWVPQFLDCDTILNLIVVPIDIANEKIVSYFRFCLDAVWQAGNEQSIVLAEIEKAVDTF